MKIYSDIELKNEITELDLGIVNAGESKEFIYYIHNEGIGNDIDLKFTVMDKDVSVVSQPNSIASEETKELVIKWSPSLTIKEGLTALLKIDGKTLWPPKG